MPQSDSIAMAVDLSIADGRVTLVLSGVLCVRDIRSVKEQMRLHPQVDRYCSLLVDLRRADLEQLSGADVRDFASLTAVFDPAPRRAFVTGDQFAYGMARMFEQLRGDRANIRVFRDIDSAESWLDEAP